MPVFGKTLISAEAYCFGVFQYENSVILKDPRSQNHFRYPFKPLKIIRRIRKYYVIPESAGFKITDHINMYRFYICETNLFNGFLYP